MPRSSATGKHALWNPFTFVGHGLASKERVDEALNELFSIKPHLSAALGMGLAALSAALAGSVPAAVAGASIAMIGLVIRFMLKRRFKSRNEQASHREIIRLFVLASSVTALTWSLSAGLLFYAGSTATRMLVIGVATAFVQGAAGRAYMMPGMALINILAVIGVVSIAGYASGNVYLLPAGVVYFCFLKGYLAQVVGHRLRQLEAEQTADRLFAEILEKNELLRVANESLAAKAYKDPLTGLANRREFDREMRSGLEKSERCGQALSLLMIDVDHFKSFNDTYGHQAGDECLQMLARSIAQTVTVPGSLVARYGGEEFVVILPATDGAAARVIAEQIRMQVRMNDMDSLHGSPQRQTVSIGVASCPAGATHSSEIMLAAADAALYQAKKTGRNRVCAKGHDTPPPATLAG
ncbi:GGDEF domain-containing protein [Pseudohoeflea suaedae]|uniref:diguanylate cyclase n=1 Tax=Pseudohoeflea suaedae TaxID=877384 RepID=A0A4R5PHL2_9HYPH|nr:GGDEF domain-containing protein [Pseudohoeflea suaedae]TDH34312.1 GGDEF domain-containing protein [Pseudohoeflea suaedae]